MEGSKRPLWKKSMLQQLNLYDIKDVLSEIYEAGDMHGYTSEQAGYYQEYKDLFDELAVGAYSLWEALDSYDLQENWDDMTVALLGYQQTVLGFDVMELDYYHMANPYCEDLAIQEAEKRLQHLTKAQLIRLFRTVMTTLVLFFDIKAAYDSLTAVVEELDSRAAMMKSSAGTPSQRMWTE